jgi:ABC-type transporter Mla subunit MlaD
MIVWGWTWLKSFNLLHAPQRFTVQFHDVAGLNNNAPVNINGVRVGMVEKVDLVSKGEVHCHIRITADKVVVTKGSKVTIQTLGLVGAKYLEINLPELRPAQEAPPALTEQDIVTGEDPVRVELVINEMATKLSKVFRAIKSDKAGTSLADALEHSGEAVKNINQASEKLNKNMDRLADVADSVQSTSNKIGVVADKAQGIESSAQTFFSHGTQTMDGVSDLAQDLRGTAKKVNKILDNPALSKDLKETVNMARQTADTVSRAMHELTVTLGDEPLRKDVLAILNRVDQSTSNIVKSLNVVKEMSDDQGLRTDLRQIVGNAKEAMGKLDDLVNEPGFKNDIRTTITKVRTAADNVDYASRQISNVLDQRAPLLRLMFGHPGRIPRELQQPGEEPKSKENAESKPKVDK